MTQDIWRSQFNLLSPAFELFSWLPYEFVAQSVWPSLAEYNALFSFKKKTVSNAQGLPIVFIDQSTGPTSCPLGYEARVYLTGEVSTRLLNWHDFFNMLVWHSFPRIKSLLNILQFQEISRRGQGCKLRTPLENFLTLFDENGMVILSAHDELLEHIKCMHWKELFWHNRSIFLSGLRCFIIGHSLHEKLLRPYIGMVGHALLLKVSASFFATSLSEQIEEVDSRISSLDFTTNTPHALFPVPVLGIPNWYQETDNACFYDDHTYFRRQRRQVRR